MAVVAPEPQVPPMVNVDKLSHEIFSILEAQFLFGYQPKQAPAQPAAAKAISGDVGRIRILTIDAAGPTDGLLAAASLARLETALRRSSSLPHAHLSDFFDLAAGSGHGGLLASLLFARGPDARPLFSAADALAFLADLRRPRKSRFNFLRRRSGGLAGRVSRAFGDLTLRDAIKPLLVPCYDLASRSAFVFSRADAVEADAFDFLLRDVCAATCGAGVEVASVDGQTRIIGLDGAVAMSNPTAAAVTHVLNNRHEFPFVRGVEDLLVVSLGNGEPSTYNVAGVCSPSSRVLARIAGGGVADMVDQAVAMAFGSERSSNYVRIQGNGCGTKKIVRLTKETATKDVLVAVEGMLKEKNVESVMFRGKKIAEKSNEEMLEMFAVELIKEEERRKLCIFPTVVIKQLTPRTSSATTSSC